ncbi:MAG: hypothetical protein ACPL7C_05760 [Anaerolineae bacterium]
MHTDHLGSTTLLTNQNQQAVARRWYLPYGEMRYAVGALPTDRLYTGQRWEVGADGRPPLQASTITEHGSTTPPWAASSSPTR